MALLGSFPVVTLTVTVTAATVAASRFVTAAGALPAAGGAALGVSRNAAVIGDQLALDCVGTVVVQAGGVIAVGGGCKVDAAGKVIAHDGAAGVNKIVAQALSASAADLDLIHVMLIPHG